MPNEAPTKEDRQRWLLNSIKGDIGDAISELPDTIEVSTEKGLRTIQVRKKAIIERAQGWTGPENHREWVDIPTVFSNVVEVRDGDKVIMTIKYTPPHKEIRTANWGGKNEEGYKVIDIGIGLSVEAGDTMVLQRGELQEGLSVESLKPIATLLTMASDKHREIQKEETDDIKKGIAEKAEETSDLIDGLV